jgi:hypothetical protein
VVEQLESADSDIVNKLNTAYRKVLVVGKDVFVPAVYSDRGRPFQFTLRELRFLNALWKTNNQLLKACEEAGVTERFARKFLKSRDYREFAVDIVNDEATANGWTQRRVVLEIDRIYSGQMQPSEEQLEALKMMKDIIVPKQRAGSGEGASGVTVNLNFPALPVDVQTKLKEIADQAALQGPTDAEDHAA